MGTAAKPIPTDTTGADAQGVPNVPRILSPDEFEQARMLSPTELAKAKFPVLPPPYIPKDATGVTGTPQVGANARNPDENAQLPGLAGILTRQVVTPALQHPWMTLGAAGATVAFPPLAYVWAAMMGKDVLEYSAQKAAEMSLPDDLRAEAEKDPDRISGEQAGTEAVMMGLGGAARAVSKIGASGKTPMELARTFSVNVPDEEGFTRGMERSPEGSALASVEKTGRESLRTQAQQEREQLRAQAKTELAQNRAVGRAKLTQHVDAVVDSWNKIFAPANRGSAASAAANIMRATTGAAAQQYEQAAFKLDDFRRAIEPLPEADKLGFIDNIEGGKTQVTPEFQKAADAIRKTLDDARTAVQNLGTGKLDSFIDNYFPHIWDDPKKAAVAFGPDRPPPEAPAASPDVARPRTASGRLKSLAKAGTDELANEYAITHAATEQDAVASHQATAVSNDPLQVGPPGELLPPVRVMDSPSEILRSKLEAELKRRGVDPAEALSKGRAAVESARVAREPADAPTDATATVSGGKTPLEQAKIAAGGKRPMEGSKSFLKQRTIPTTAEGIAAGLRPVSTNPVDLTLLKIREMQRYVMAHESLNQMKDAGLVKYVRAGERPPDGYARIDDKIATVFGPRSGAVTLPEGAVQAISTDAGGAMTGAVPVNPEDVQVTGTRIMGQYHAPEPVARIVNNYLSPGLRGNAWYDAYRGFGNMLNQAQLGLSAFHLAFTSLDAIVSRTALGLEYLHQGLTTGDPAAVKMGLRKANPLTSWTAAVPGIAQGTVGDLLNHFAGTDIQMGLGAKIRAAYLDPEHAPDDMRALANAWKEGGGRVRQDSFYANSSPEKMMSALRAGEYGKATLLSVPALLEGAAKPIMEHIVPLQKLQVGGEMLQKALKDLPPDATLADRRAASARVVDDVENRMGQLTYDNLFWNKTFKDLMMAGQRSVGWNIGIVRGAAGGAEDLATMAKKTLTPGEHGELTNRAAYLFALPLVVGMYGAVYQYLRTGKGPETLNDYYNPQNGDLDADGNPERVRLPSYTNDAQSVSSHPVQTVLNKLAPLPAAMVAMLQNKDFYGDEIRNPDDPAVKQIGQEIEYVAKEFEPFSLRNMLEQSGRSNTSTSTKLGNWFGIKPAPREVVRTPAQNEMADIAARRGGGTKTPEEADAAQSRATLLAALRGNKNIDLQAAVTDAIEHHGVTAPQIGKLLKEAGTSPAQERFKTLTVSQAIDVFKKATPREQQMFGELLLKKVETAATRGSP